MSIVVDEMGNIWNRDDTERKRPAMPHPELEGDQARCPCKEAYIYRVKTGGSLGHETFEWRCACGRTFPGFHH